MSKESLEYIDQIFSISLLDFCGRILFRQLVHLVLYLMGVGLYYYKNGGDLVGQKRKSVMDN